MAALIWLCSLLAIRAALCQLSSGPESYLLQPSDPSSNGAGGEEKIENWRYNFMIDEVSHFGPRNVERERERRDVDTEASGEGSGEKFQTPHLQLEPLSLTPGNLSLITDTLVSVLLSHSSQDCRRGWEGIFNSKSSRGTSNGVAALDAFGKVGAGYLEGNRFALGSYDECHSLPSTQYCLAELMVKQQLAGSTLQLLYAMCLPQTCSENDIISAANITSSQLDGVALGIGEMSCERESKAPYNAGSIVILFVWSSFALMVSVATTTQFITRKMKEFEKSRAKVEREGDVETAKPRLLTKKKQSRSETLMKLLLSFSLYETVPKVVEMKKQPDSAITCLHGMRVISMCWVILGHISLFTYLFLENQISYVKNSVSDISYRGITGAVFAVDSFFLMSGLLVTYLTLRGMNRANQKIKEKMEKDMSVEKGKVRLGKRKILSTFPALQYYIHRYLRLTPVYAFVLFSYWLLTVHLADGPIWRNTTGEDSHFYQSCEKYWWTNLLYINNIYPQRHLDICMPWSWYLANDMQFYIAAPLIILPLALYPALGVALIVLLVPINLAIIGGISGGYGFTSNSAKFAELQAALEETDSSHNVTDDVYTKPWTRVGPYLIGILMGFILYRQQQKPVFELKEHNYVFYGCLWALAAVLCLSTVYGVQGPFSGDEFNKAEDLSYQMFSRLAWAIGVAIVIFACHHGYGWIINDFLSMKFWIPLSRITFTTYLVHGIVLYLLIFTGRRPFVADTISQTYAFIFAVVLSFGSAAVISTFVEFPISNLEEMAFELVGFRARESTRRSTVRERDCKIKKNVGFEDEEDGEGRERGEEIAEEVRVEGERNGGSRTEECEVEFFDNSHAEGEGEGETEGDEREMGEGGREGEEGRNEAGDGDGEGESERGGEGEEVTEEAMTEDENTEKTNSDEESLSRGSE